MKSSSLKKREIKGKIKNLELLLEFRSSFYRKATFHWFVVIIVGLMVGGDSLGLTSIMRDLNIAPRSYEAMIHFFYSKVWCLEKVHRKWMHLVKQHAPAVKVDGRYVLPADGMKQAKEAKRMPGVKQVHQGSSSASKPTYIQGHVFGSVGILVGNKVKKLGVPLYTNLQEGVATAFEWEGHVEPTRLTSQADPGVGRQAAPHHPSEIL